MFYAVGHSFTAFSDSCRRMVCACHTIDMLLATIK